jgi:hypothetical protein
VKFGRENKGGVRWELVFKDYKMFTKISLKLLCVGIQLCISMNVLHVVT